MLLTHPVCKSSGRHKPQVQHYNKFEKKQQATGIETWDACQNSKHPSVSPPNIHSHACLPLGYGLLQQFQPQSFGTLRLFRGAPALHRLLIGIGLAQVRKAKGIRLYRCVRRRVLAIDLIQLQCSTWILEIVEHKFAIRMGRQCLKSKSYWPYGRLGNLARVYGRPPIF